MARAKGYGFLYAAAAAGAEARVGELLATIKAAERQIKSDRAELDFLMQRFGVVVGGNGHAPRAAAGTGTLKPSPPEFMLGDGSTLAENHGFEPPRRRRRSGRGSYRSRMSGIVSAIKAIVEASPVGLTVDEVRKQLPRRLRTRSVSTTLSQLSEAGGPFKRVESPNGKRASTYSVI